MKLANRILAWTLSAVVAMTAIVPATAMAQTKAKDAKREKTHRTTATALGAAGLYLYSRKQTTLGTIAVAGSAYEAKRMQDSINNRHKRERAAAYRRGLRHGEYLATHKRTRYGSSYHWVKGKDGKMHKVYTKKKMVAKKK
jgi:hypothetical protein